MKLVLVTTLAAVMLFVAACSNNDPVTENPSANGQETSAPANPPAETPALQKIAFSLPDPQGVVHSADEWIGKKPVVINFWGTWCGPCRREIPDMVRVYDEYKDRVEFLGIALNDTPEKVNAFTSQYRMTWVMLLGNPAVAGQFGIRGIPTTYFVDAGGNLASVPDYNGNNVTQYIGPRDYATFKRAIETILASTPSES